MNIGQTTDYLYCEDCKEYVNLLRYGEFDNHSYRMELTGHVDHNLRDITEQELHECQELPIYMPLTRHEIGLLERGMRLLRWNSLASNNEDKKHIPAADKLITNLQEVI